MKKNRFDYDNNKILFSTINLSLFYFASLSYSLPNHIHQLPAQTLGGTGRREEIANFNTFFLLFPHSLNHKSITFYYQSLSSFSVHIVQRTDIGWL